MKFYLKINDEWVAPDFDTNDEQGIQLYWTFDNLSNPMEYVGEYSYDFTLPFTNTNKQIFKNFEVLDSLTDSNLSNGKVFHPNVLIDYIIHTTNDVISNGQAYLSEINENGYVLNLNGSLCTAFTKLLNSGWDTAKKANDDDYYLFDDVEKTLNAQLVYNMWMNDEPTAGLDPTFSDISDVITVVPQHQGKYSDFASDKILKYSSSIFNLGFKESDIFNENNTAMNEWQMQEYRCYEQNFAVYMRKLWLIYQRKCKEICDYDLVLDNRWFSETYELLANMVYVLGRIKTPSALIQQNYGTVSSSTVSLPNVPSLGTSHIVAGLTNVTTQHTILQFTAEQGGVVDYQYEIELKYNSLSAVQNTTPYVLFTLNNALVINIEFTQDGNTIHTVTKKAVLLPDTVNQSTGEYIINLSNTNYASNCIVARYTPQPMMSSNQFNCVIADTIRFVSPATGNITGRVTVGYDNNNPPFMTIAYYGGEGRFYGYYPLNHSPQMTTTLSSMYTTNQATHSGQSFTLEKVFGDTNPFTILLKYTKLYGMIWQIDDYNKTIIVKRRADYFWDMTHVNNNLKNPNEDIYKGFLDITDEVDGTSYVITPLAWDTRKVEINYNKADDMYVKRYADKYGRTYGSAQVITENYLNKDSRNLLCTGENDTINPSCIVTPYYTPYNYQETGRQMKLKCSPAPTNQTDGEEQADMANNFYFRLSNTILPVNMHTGGYRKDTNGNYAIISNDTDYEINNNVYLWHDDITNIMSGGKVVREMPNYSTVRNGYSLQMAAPYELYYNIPPSLRLPTRPASQPTQLTRLDFETSIIYTYDKEHKAYISEVYSINNKTIEVNVTMNGMLYRRLKSIPLVIIKDVAYLVTEIEGWNEYQHKTKIKLRQISDYSKLESGNGNGTSPIRTWNTIDGTAPEELPESHDIEKDTDEDVTVDWDTIPDKENYYELTTERQ